MYNTYMYNTYMYMIVHSHCMYMYMIVQYHAHATQSLESDNLRTELFHLFICGLISAHRSKKMRPNLIVIAMKNKFSKE